MKILGVHHGHMSLITNGSVAFSMSMYGTLRIIRYLYRSLFQDHLQEILAGLGLLALTLTISIDGIQLIDKPLILCKSI